MGQLTQSFAEVQNAIDQQYDGEQSVEIGWDDMRSPATTIRQGATNKPDFDATNLGLLFPQNNATEIAYSILQFPHGYKEGSNIKPHLHYIQDEASDPVFKIDYKWYNADTAIPVSFTTLTQTGTAFTWSSGSLHQIATFPEIVGTGMKLSSMFDVKIYRDDNVVAGDVLVKEFDIHYQIDQERGSRQEFIK